MITRGSLTQTLKNVAVSLGTMAAVLTAVGLVVTATALRRRNVVLAGQEEEEPRAVGTFGEDLEGSPLELAMIGDSLAVGIGADSPEHTVGALLATTLAERAAHPVTLYNVAVSGADSRDLAPQIDDLFELTEHPDVAVIIVGGNDVMHRNNVTVAARHLYRAVRTLRKSGCHVVVATCPDMGSIRALVRPLRYVAHRASRSLARAQTLVVLRAGGRPVPLGVTLGPIFVHKPAQMFSTDHFHPSSLGYARAAALLLPSVSAAALLVPES